MEKGLQLMLWLRVNFRSFIKALLLLLQKINFGASIFHSLFHKIPNNLLNTEYCILEILLGIQEVGMSSFSRFTLKIIDNGILVQGLEFRSAFLFASCYSLSLDTKICSFSVCNFNSANWTF